MDEARFTELLIKKRSGNISLHEQRELAQLVRQNAGWKVIADAIDDFFYTPISFTGDVSSDKAETSLFSVKKKIAASKSTSQTSIAKVYQLKWLQIAIAVVLVFTIAGLSWFFLYKKHTAALIQNIVATQKGSKSNIILPDGTKVWMNAETELVYQKSFGENTREVILKGEAYFDVVKDKNRPFIVHTSALDVKAIGTIFNVRAYNSEANTQATLVSGLIEVTLKKKNNERLLLKPKEKITILNNSSGNPGTADTVLNAPQIVLSSVALNPVDSGILETQWIKNSIHFDQQKLVDIIPMLEKWYNIHITVATPSLLQRRFSGSVKSESLGETLEFFKLASGLKYKIDKENVTIYK